MTAIPVTLDAAPDIVSGLNSGDLTRIGGVVREAASGRIVAHLQEVGRGTDALQQGLKAVAGLSQIAAGASVLNLGVSAIGFAYTAHRLNQISSAISSMHNDMTMRFDAVDAAVSRIDGQLGYLTALAVENRDVQQQIRAGVSALIMHSVFDSVSKVAALARVRANFGAEFGRSDVLDLETLLDLLYTKAATITPRLDTEGMVNLDLCLQGWMTAGALLADSYRTADRPGPEREVLSRARSQATELAESWTSALLRDPDPAMNTVQRLQVPALRAWIPTERVNRITRYSTRDRGIPDAEAELRRRDAQVAQAMAPSDRIDSWVASQTGVAAFLDVLAENADRAFGKEALALDDSSVTALCIEAAPSVQDGVLVIEAA